MFHSLPLPIAQLSLAAVLKCGQSFRWLTLSVAGDVEYRLCLRDRVVCLRQSPTTLFYRAVFPDPQPSPVQQALRDAETLVWLNDYFQLDVDLTTLYHEWSTRDHVFAKIQSRFQGIRVLRQDPWENLVSFICSSNNNISRITKMIQVLCTHFSPPLLSFPGEASTYHPFPPPSALAKHDVSATLRSLGFGYRADFVYRTAKMLVDTHGILPSSDTSEASEKWLLGLRNNNTDEARQVLLKFTGVGRKVADCVLLMSLDKKEVVPVDTHVYQIAAKYYGVKSSAGKKTNMTSKIYEDVGAKLMNVWGDYAGWAHSVLFTADLRSFSSYGLLTSTSPESLLPPKKYDRSAMLKPMETLLPLSQKRSYEGVVEVKHVNPEICGIDSSTLAERVKQRRRII